MAGRIHYLADRLNIRSDACGCFVVDATDGLNLAPPVFHEFGFEGCARHAMPPVPRDKIDDERQPLGQLPPEGSEMSGFKHQHPVPGRKRIDEGSLPGAGARSWVDHDGVCGFEDRLQPVKNSSTEFGKFGSAMIDNGTIDSAQNSVRDVGWTWNLQEVPAGSVGHMPGCPLS
jgi:hypothetical protein